MGTKGEGKREKTRAPLILSINRCFKGGGGKVDGTGVTSQDLLEDTLQAFEMGEVEGDPMDAKVLDVVEATTF